MSRTKGAVNKLNTKQACDRLGIWEDKFCELVTLAGQIPEIDKNGAKLYTLVQLKEIKKLI